jgi:hypothetical protein
LGAILGIPLVILLVQALVSGFQVELLLPLGIAGAVSALFWAMKLETELGEKGVHFAWRPFQRNQITYAWEDIERAYVRKYKPIAEYGGWGLRYGSKGRAHNVSGVWGIQLELKDGKHILFGTQRPEEARFALSQLGFAQPQEELGE